MVLFCIENSQVVVLRKPLMLVNPYPPPPPPPPDLTQRLCLQLTTQPLQSHIGFYGTQAVNSCAKYTAHAVMVTTHQTPLLDGCHVTQHGPVLSTKLHEGCEHSYTRWMTLQR